MNPLRRLAIAPLAIALATVVATPTIGDDSRRASVPALKIPVGWINEGDERSLEMIQEAVLDEAIELELAALAKEGGGYGQNDPRGGRISTDRAMVEEFAKRAHVSTIHTTSRHELPLTDRYLLAFVREKLRTSAVPMTLIEAWIAQNQRYLASGQIHERQPAIASRDRFLRAMVINSKLRRIASDITQNPLDPEVRSKLVETLQIAFPDAPLPELKVQPTLPPGLSASLAALTGGGATSPPNFAGSSNAPGGLHGGASPSPSGAPPALPKLDGVETPKLQIHDLRATLEALQGGGSAGQR